MVTKTAADEALTAAVRHAIARCRAGAVDEAQRLMEAACERVAASMAGAGEARA